LAVAGIELFLLDCPPSVFSKLKTRSKN